MVPKLMLRRHTTELYIGTPKQHLATAWSSFGTGLKRH